MNNDRVNKQKKELMNNLTESVRTLALLTC